MSILSRTKKTLSSFEPLAEASIHHPIFSGNFEEASRSSLSTGILELER
jgi:hypothetical protein